MAFVQENGKVVIKKVSLIVSLQIDRCYQQGSRGKRDHRQKGFEILGVEIVEWEKANGNGLGGADTLKCWRGPIKGVHPE